MIFMFNSYMPWKPNYDVTCAAPNIEFCLPSASLPTIPDWPKYTMQAMYKVTFIKFSTTNYCIFLELVFIYLT